MLQFPLSNLLLLFIFLLIYKLLIFPELKALEDPRLTLVEKLSAAQAILVSLKTCKIQVVQEILSWFVKTKDELMRSQNKSPAEIDLLYESLNKCIQITTMLHIPIYQIKFNIMDSLLKVSLGVEYPSSHTVSI